MTLREDIIRISGGKTEVTQRAEDFLKAYLKDKKVFGEDTADIYASVYGDLMNEDYSNLFESVDSAYEVLTEEGFKIDPKNIYASDPGNWKHSYKEPIVDTHNFAKDSRDLMAAIKDQTLLGKIGNFFRGVKDSVTSGQVFSGLKNGLSWMVSPAGLPIVAGSAAGIGVIVAVIAALRKKGKNKDAEKLQAALDAAKKKKK